MLIVTYCYYLKLSNPADFVVLNNLNTVTQFTEHICIKFLLSVAKHDLTFNCLKMTLLRT